MALSHTPACHCASHSSDNHPPVDIIHAVAPTGLAYSNRLGIVVTSDPIIDDGLHACMPQIRPLLSLLSASCSNLSFTSCLVRFLEVSSAHIRLRASETAICNHCDGVSIALYTALYGAFSVLTNSPSFSLLVTAVVNFFSCSVCHRTNPVV